MRLDDAIDSRERLALLAGLLPADAAYSHATAAALLGAHVDLPARAHVAMTPRRVLPQRAEFVVHARGLTEQDVVLHRGLRTTSGPQTWLDLAAVTAQCHGPARGASAPADHLAEVSVMKVSRAIAPITKKVRNCSRSATH